MYFHPDNPCTDPQLPDMVGDPHAAQMHKSGIQYSAHRRVVVNLLEQDMLIRSVLCDKTMQGLYHPSLRIQESASQEINKQWARQHYLQHVPSTLQWHQGAPLRIRHYACV